ncbi:MAG: flagellar biosynthetic protein FliO [Terracidiphilus sp.]
MAIRASGETKDGRGLGAWLVEKLRGRQRSEPRLALLERINLAPRQSLELVEAEGRRILVATSPEGGPAFYPLDGNRNLHSQLGTSSALRGRSRTSW